MSAKTLFQNFEGAEWAQYFGNYHAAVRCYFHPTMTYQDRVQPLRDLSQRLRQRMVVSLKEVPPQYAQWAPVDRAVNAGANHNPTRGIPGLASPKPRQADSKVDDQTLQIMTAYRKRVGPVLANTKKEVELAGKPWSFSLLFPKYIGEAFGAMRALVRPNSNGYKKPCPRLFTQGKRTTNKCRSSHSLTETHSHTGDDQAIYGVLRAQVRGNQGGGVKSLRDLAVSWDERHIAPERHCHRRSETRGPTPPTKLSAVSIARTPHRHAREERRPSEPLLDGRAIDAMAED